MAPHWPIPVLVCGLALTWMLAALAAIDLDVRRLPDVITLPAYPASLLALAGCSWAVGDWAALGRAVVAGASLALAYHLLARLTRTRGAAAEPDQAGFGGGDVKLAGVIGLVLGWFGWGQVLLGSYAAFLTGGLWAAVLMASGRLSRHGHVPFGPFLGLGAITGLCLA